MMKDDDFKLFRGFASRRTDGRTDERTFVNVESLSRLKRYGFKVRMNANGVFNYSIAY